MATSQRILVVAATERELAALEQCDTLRCGVGPVESAAATAAAIARVRPAAILQVGIAGARRARGLAAGSLVVGTESIYCDLLSTLPDEWAAHSVRADATLLSAATRAVPDAALMPIGTSARVGGTSGCDVEAMEGFGVLRAAQLAGVPAIEVRAISNIIEENDRALWRFDEAFAAITTITPRIISELQKCVN